MSASGRTRKLEKYDSESSQDSEGGAGVSVASVASVASGGGRGRSLRRPQPLGATSARNTVARSIGKRRCFMEGNCATLSPPPSTAIP